MRDKYERRANIAYVLSIVALVLSCFGVTLSLADLAGRL